MTQTQKIYKYLKQYGSITPLEALQEFGCMRLAARISDLRSMGVKIKAQTARSINQYGEVVHFAKYRLLGDTHEQQS